MQSLVESFLESDFDSRQLARQKRDERLAELSAKGYSCRVENLTTIHTGLSIFFVIAQPTREVEERALPAEPQPSLSSAQLQRPQPKQISQPRDPKPGKLRFDDLSHATQTDRSKSTPESSPRSRPQNRLRSQPKNQRDFDGNRPLKND